MSAQLVVRLTVIAALLGIAGVWSYSATHWDETISGTAASNPAPRAR